MTTDDLLKQGIAALRAGRKAEARNLLMQVVQQDERNEMGWLWLGGAVDTDQERRICLENVLAINPNNEMARRGLESLIAKEGVRSLRSVSPPTPSAEPAATLGEQPTQPSTETTTPDVPQRKRHKAPPKRKKAAKQRTGLTVGIGVGVLMVACIGVVVIWWVFSSGLLPLGPAAPVAVDITQEPSVADATPASSTRTPTWTPCPADTPVSTATPIPTAPLQPTVTPEPIFTPIPAATPAPLGEIVSFADWDYMVAEATVMTTIGDEIPRGVYVVALVRVTNKGATERRIGNIFVAKDDQGRLYEMDTDASLEYHQVHNTDYWYLSDIGPSFAGIVPVVFDLSPDASSVLLRPAGVNDPAVLLVADVGGEPLTLPGEPQSTAGWSYVVTGVSTTSIIGNEVARGRYVAIILAVRNDSLTPRELGSQLFALKDSEGRTYEMDRDASLEYHQVFDTDAWYLESIGPSLNGIVPLVFDTATDASGFVLVTREGTKVPLP